jgi:hypothetical protein
MPTIHKDGIETQWIHYVGENAGEVCDSQEVSEEIPGIGLCLDHDRRVKRVEKPAEGNIKIEIIHGRDPDSSCGHTVFLNGVRFDNAEIVDLDPGRGWLREDWDEFKESALATGTPAFREALAAEFEAFDGSKYIEED